MVGAFKLDSVLKYGNFRFWIYTFKIRFVFHFCYILFYNSLSFQTQCAVKKKSFLNHGVDSFTIFLSFFLLNLEYFFFFFGITRFSDIYITIAWFKIIMLYNNNNYCIRAIIISYRIRNMNTKSIIVRPKNPKWVSIKLKL